MKHFPGEDVIEEILPVHKVTVRIQIPQHEQVCRVYLAPTGEDLPYRLADGWVEAVVPTLDDHAMVVVEVAGPAVS